MVGAMMLLKLLHCKKVREKLLNSKKYRQSTSRDKPALNVKMEVGENEEQRVCRVCLKRGDIPIYGSDGFEDVSDQLNIFGDILVTFDDIHPKFICDSCHALLQGAVLFRKTAQESDRRLKKGHDVLTLVENEADDFHYDMGDDSNASYNFKADGDLSIPLHDEEEKKEPIVPTGYYCSKCDVAFKTFKEYLDHRMTPEHESKKKLCPICNKEYNRAYLIRHLALHRKETPYMCDVCGKKFTVLGQCNRHRLTHFYHLPFKCSLCPYRGRFSESVKMHMKSHTGEKLYQCPHCPNRRFVNKSNLNNHLLIHSGVRNFQCDLCPRAFYRRWDLKAHLKAEHTTVKDHVCETCGKPFGTRKQVMKHQLKVHKRAKLRSGRKPLYLIAGNTEPEDQEEEVAPVFSES